MAKKIPEELRKEMEEHLKQGKFFTPHPLRIIPLMHQADKTFFLRKESFPTHHKRGVCLHSKMTTCPICEAIKEKEEKTMPGSSSINIPFIGETRGRMERGFCLDIEGHTPVQEMFHEIEPKSRENIHMDLMNRLWQGIYSNHDRIGGNMFGLGDIVRFNIHGDRPIDYKVKCNNNRYYLETVGAYEDNPNSVVFQKLGFDTKRLEHFKWCKHLVGYDVDYTYHDFGLTLIFPELKSLDDLNKVIDALKTKIKKEEYMSCTSEHNKSRSGKLRKSRSGKLRIEDLHIGQIVYHDNERCEVIGLSQEFATIQTDDCEADRRNVLPQRLTLEPEFDFDDPNTVIKLHCELWEWLENHPDKGKGSWPRWRKNGGDVPDVRSECFYCEYAARQRDKEHSKSRTLCNYCPGGWRTDEKHQPCVAGAFGIWGRAGDDLTIRRMAATIIKNT